MRLETDLERVRLGEGPTPVRELGELGEERGLAPVWVKDDGAYSAFGGNKARKLEWLLAHAVARGKHTIITGGAVGTNHGLATALFARRLGIGTVLVLVPQPDSDHVRRQLDRLRRSGAELHFAPGVVRAHLVGARLMLARASPPFNLPYVLPPGGSAPLGCVGYVEAAPELSAQVASGELPEPSHVIVALGSGGTAAGLAAGMKLAGLRSRLVCVLVTDVIKVDAARVARLARRTLRLVARHGARVDAVDIDSQDIDVVDGWLGGGYGHSSPEAERAIDLLAEREDSTLEPVYTAKAMAALLELNRRGAFGEGPVLFWHTFQPLPARASDEVAVQARSPGPRGLGLDPAAPEAKPRSRR